MRRYPIESIKYKFLNLILSLYVPCSPAFYWSDSKKGNLKAKQRPRTLPRSCAIVADEPGRCLPNISCIPSFPETSIVAPASVLVNIIVAIRGRYRWAIWTGWVLATAGIGLPCLLGVETSIVVWTFLNIVPGHGAGLLFPSIVLTNKPSIPDPRFATPRSFFQRHKTARLTLFLTATNRHILRTFFTIAIITRELSEVRGSGVGVETGVASTRLGS
jgi:hypothetical protein